MSKLNFKATNVFERNNASTARIVANQGGTRSSKTYSLAQLFAMRLLTMDNTLFTVVRKTLPALKASAMRDFFTVLKEWGYYVRENHNLTDNNYRYGSSEIEFISADQPTKLKSRKRHYLWAVEVNELTYDDWMQLLMRTEVQIFLEYNPSEQFHWIYDEVLPRDDCELIKSTYRDNPFLDEVTIREIERLEEADPNYWQIYGLGEIGKAVSNVYSHWVIVKEFPEVDDYCYAIDFGYNNPTALLWIGFVDEDLYWKQRLYQSHLTTPEIIGILKDQKITKKDTIWADSARPDQIEEIRRAGFNIKGASKDVKAGIDHVKSRRLFIHSEDVDCQKEIKGYKWKEDKNGNILEEPVKWNDHLMDCGRYGSYNHHLKLRKTKKAKFNF